MSTDEQNKQLKTIIETALFASSEPLSLSRLIALFPLDAAPDREDIKRALADLEEDYLDRGVQLRKVGKAYRFQSREKYSPWLRKLGEGRSLRYTRALLETLAIIAYRQPVTRGDIEDIRGVSVSGETMKTLLDREWVKQVGQREVAGRPTLFGTTQQFLEYFNLENLGQLPPLMEKREPAEIALELNLRLPLEEVGGVDEQTDELVSNDGQNSEILSVVEVPEQEEGDTTDPDLENPDENDEIPVNDGKLEVIGST